MRAQFGYGAQEVLPHLRALNTQVFGAQGRLKEGAHFLRDCYNLPEQLHVLGVEGVDP